MISNSPHVHDRPPVGLPLCVGGEPPRKLARCWNGTMNLQEDAMDSHEKGRVVGISLVAESGSISENNTHVLGVVIVRNTSPLSVANLRSEVSGQLQPLPDHYRFLTSRGWPLRHHQEEVVAVDDVISPEGVVRLQASYREHRVGVVMESGYALGFVGVSLVCPLEKLRLIMQEQLADTSSLTNYHCAFLDRNGWPVSGSQEDGMCVLDIVQNHVVRVRALPQTDLMKNVVLAPPSVAMVRGHSIARSTTPTPVQSPPVQHTNTEMMDVDNVTCTINPVSNTCGYSRSNSTTCNQPVCVSKDVPSHGKAKQFLISYVRAEAACAAKVLKYALEQRGYSVYLDVYEIKGGNDWQDSLNEAIASCSVFVPIVTANYGETLWTNREVKLADVLGKTIVPISCIDDWPPKCLAIQFATTQFVRWSGQTLGGTDSKAALLSGALAAANEIHERCSSLLKGGLSPVLSVTPSLPTSLKSYASVQLLPRNFTSWKQIASSRDGRPLIVLSHDTAQEVLGRHVSNILQQQGWEVWTSNVRVPAPDSVQGIVRRSMFPRCNSFARKATNVMAKLPDCIQSGFVRKADESGAVVFLLSRAFAVSCECKKQMFYCEQRKHVVPILCEDFTVPCWIQQLYGHAQLIKHNQPNFQNVLLSNLQQIFTLPPEKKSVEVVLSEQRLLKQVAEVRENIPQNCCVVYVTGSTEFHSTKSPPICSAVGQELAKHESVVLLTGGYRGVGLKIAEHFSLERKRSKFNAMNLFHSVAVTGGEVIGHSHSTFAPLSGSQQLVCGESMQEVSEVVARLADFCIVVEGDRETAQEAQLCAWHDVIVIPVQVTGGAAAGEHSMQEQLLECPPLAEPSLWSKLSSNDTTPHQVGQVVTSMVCSMFEKLHTNDDYTLVGSPTSQASTVIIEESQQ